MKKINTFEMLDFGQRINKINTNIKIIEKNDNNNTPVNLINLSSDYLTIDYDFISALETFDDDILLAKEKVEQFLRDE